MRTLPASQETARTVGQHSVMQIVSIAWPAGTEYYSTRGTDVFDPDSDKTINPWILDPLQFERSMNLDIVSSRPAHKARLFLVEDPDAGTSIRTKVAAINPIGLEILLYEVYKPVSGSLTSADWITVGRFRITQTEHTSVDLATGFAYGVWIMVEDFLQFIGEATVGRLVTTDLYPDAVKTLGAMIPIVLGFCADVPCLLVDSGGRTTLDSACEYDDETIYCVNASVLPATGRIIIDSERIDYTARNTTTNILSGLTRGANGTTPAEHLYGAAIIEEKTYTKFAVCDVAADAVDNVKCNGRLLPSYDAGLPDLPSYEAVESERPSGSGISVAEIWLYNFPIIKETGTTTSLLRLKDADTPIVMANDSSSGNVTDASDAVDYTEDDAHVTFAKIAANAVLKLKQTNDLSALTLEIKRAFAIVEYQVGLAGGDWPSNAPTLGVFAGEVEVASATLAEPTDIETTLNPEDDPENDSTELFRLAEGSLGVQTNFATLHASHGDWSYTIAQDPTVTGYMSWDNKSVIQNAPTHFENTFDPDTEGGFFGFSAADGDQKFRIKDDGTIPDNIEATRMVFQAAVKWGDDISLSVAGLSASDSVSGANFQLGAAFVDAPEGEPFTKADILGARGKIEESGTQYVQAESIRLFIYSLQGLVGETTLLDGTTLTSRVTQRLDITTAVRAAGGWAWFDGSGADYPNIQIQFPANPENNTEIRVYDAGFQVEVVDTMSSLITEDTAEITCDVMGIVNPATHNLSGIEAVHKLLTGSATRGGAQVAPKFFEFDSSGTDLYDYTSLFAAVKSATQGWGLSWAVGKRIAERTTLNDLLAEFCMAAGIRYMIDSGRIRFTPSIIADFGTSVMTLDKSLMQSTPERMRTPPALVVNDLTLYYTQRYDEIGYSAFVENANPDSQAQGWGIRSLSLNIPTVRVAGVAARLAEIIVGDFSWSRTLMEFSMYGCQASHLEVGDVVTLDSNLAIPSLSSVVGRIVRIKTGSSPDLMEVRVAVDDSFMRVWEHSDSGSYIDVYPAWGRAVIVLNETTVAELSSIGLQIKGILIEAAWDSPVAMTNTIERSTSPTNLRFGVNTTGNQDPASDSIELAMTLDTSGNLRVALSIETSTYPTSLSASQWTDPGAPATWWQQLGRIELNHLDNKNDLVFTPDKVTTYALLTESDRAFISRRIIENAL